MATVWPWQTTTTLTDADNKGIRCAAPPETYQQPRSMQTEETEKEKHLPPLSMRKGLLLLSTVAVAVTVVDIIGLSLQNGKGFLSFFLFPP